MGDPRIDALVQAAEELEQGHFDIALPGGSGDELDRVAEALERLSQVLARRFAELRALTAVTERVNAGLLLDEVCAHVYDSFRGLLPYDRIGLALLEDEGRVLRARWARSDAGEIHLPVGYAAPMEGSSLERILATGKPRILNDLSAYLAQHPGSDSTRRVVAEGVRSSLTCPLRAEGRPVGFIFFSSFEAGVYARQHVEVYQALAGQLSVIVEKSRLYQELLELGRLKDRLLGVAAHDLRNPLTLVLTSLELLSSGAGGNLEAGGQDLVERAMRAAERMVRLIDELLDVSAIETGHLALGRVDLELGAWLASRVEDQRLLAGSKQITLELAVPEQPVVVQADPNRLDQVVTNLLSNAIKYSPSGARVQVQLRTDAAEVELAVEDHGQGIPAHELPRVFMPFARTSARPTAGESSTGLGMAITRKLVQAHDGRIAVESQPGLGTTFRVWLPRPQTGSQTGSGLPI